MPRDFLRKDISDGCLDGAGLEILVIAFFDIFLLLLFALQLTAKIHTLPDWKN